MSNNSPFADFDKNDLIALAPHFAELVKRVGSIGDAFVEVEVLKAFQAHGLSLSLNHYYSPIPDIKRLPESLWDGPGLATGWSRVRVDDYLPLLRTVIKYADELKDIPREGTCGFCWENPMFPPLDAIAYYGIIRHRKPRHILEIGSGFSTLLADRAIKANGSGFITCIEPYPRDFLCAMQGQYISVDQIKVQDVPGKTFSNLVAGDLLFIDTSHVTKAGSDVNDILFRIMPLIKRGVIVHIHDMLLPYEYPRRWYHDIGIVWNEQYAVLALLMDNPRLKVILPNYLAAHEHDYELTEALKDFDIWGLAQNLGGAKGASLWLEVEAD